MFNSFLPKRRGQPEIALVQSIDKSNPITDLMDLLQKHPTILKVLQILIAHTPDRIYFSDPAYTIDFKADLETLAKKGTPAASRAAAHSEDVL